MITDNPFRNFKFEILGGSETSVMCVVTHKDFPSFQFLELVRHDSVKTEGDTSIDNLYSILFKQVNESLIMRMFNCKANLIEYPNHDKKYQVLEYDLIKNKWFSINPETKEII